MDELNGRGYVWTDKGLVNLNSYSSGEIEAELNSRRNGKANKGTKNGRVNHKTKGKIKPEPITGRQEENIAYTEEELWAAYRESPGTDTRNKLAEFYQPFVRQVASDMIAAIGERPAFDLVDLTQEGMFGVMEEIGRYDDSFGVRFITFSYRRVKGAMMDYLREIEWKPRLVLDRMKAITKTRRDHYKKTGEVMALEEAVNLINPGSAKENWIKDGRVVKVQSVEQPIYEKDSGKSVTVRDTIPDHRETQSDWIERVNLLCKGLSRAETLIIKLTYIEGLEMRTVGRTIGISESRVSQLHAGLIDRLKSDPHKLKTLVGERLRIAS